MKDKRSYGQYCPAARTLDLVGERWTLLLVRELLLGPRRYSDLVEALPGIGTNLLTERLRRLEDEGLVRRRRLGSPVRSAVYELTERGKELEPVLMALAHFGMGRLDERRRGEAFRPEWLLFTVRATFNPERARGVRETYEFRVEDESMHVVVDDGRVATRPGPAEQPDVVLEADAPTFVRLGRGELSPAEAAAGAMKVQGSAAALRRCVDVLGIGAAATPTRSGRG